MYICRVCKGMISNKENSILYCSVNCLNIHTREKETRSFNRKRKTIEKRVTRELQNKIKILKKKNKELSKKLKSSPTKAKSLSFYDTQKWRTLRLKALIEYGRKCSACYSTEKPLHVDHIKPRSKYPELELNINNLQILCEDCNLGKSNKIETNFRKESV